MFTLYYGIIDKQKRGQRGRAAGAVLPVLKEKQQRS